MKIKVLEDKKTRLVVEVEGETHTFCNAIKKELWKDENVKAAGYNISHPYVGIPKIVVETNTSTTPKKALEEAIKRLKSDMSAFDKAFQKAY